jgi:hypothetical protein
LTQDDPGGRERAAGHRSDTERGEELGRYLGSDNLFRQISAREFKWARAVGGDGFERLLIASQVLEVERRKRQAVDVSLGESFLERHQPIRVGVAERPNQRRIDDAEERRVRADTQAERQDDDAGERDAAAKLPCRVAEVAKQAGEAGSEGPGFPQVFANPRDAAKPAACARTRVGGAGRAKLLLTHASRITSSSVLLSCRRRKRTWRCRRPISHSVTTVLHPVVSSTRLIALLAQRHDSVVSFNRLRPLA